MQTSAIKRLLHPIKALMSRNAKKQWEATSEVAELSNTEMPIEEESAEDRAFENSEQAEVSVSDDENFSDIADEASDGESQEQAENHDVDSPSQSGNRSHLTSSVPKTARAPIGAITKQEMAEIRSIFGDMDDSEIHRLYKRVTK